MKVGDLVVSKHKSKAIFKVIEITESFQDTNKKAIKVDRMVDSWKVQVFFWEEDFRHATPEEISKIIAEKMLA